uniref:Uncharacterized protein n=1 Tax=Psilocybe cubensis TaxID=181762 RepID=A0A8H7XZP8_PSICU
MNILTEHPKQQLPESPSAAKIREINKKYKKKQISYLPLREVALTFQLERVEQSASTTSGIIKNKEGKFTLKKKPTPKDMKKFNA